MSHILKRTGELLLIVSAVMEGLFPIIVNQASFIFSPFFFVGFTSLMAALLIGFYLLCSRKLFSGVTPQVLFYAFMIAILIIIFPFTLIFIGTKLTSSINTALLLQAEMLFTFLIVGLLLREKHTSLQLLGAATIALGTFFVIYNGSFQFNKGDMLILIASITLPFGNLYAKKALTLISPLHILFFRYVFAGVILLSISVLFEDISNVQPMISNHILLLSAYVLLILIISKVCWYQGLKRLPLTKAVYIISSNPAFALIFAFLLLRETPNIYQICGFIITIAGVYVLVSKRPTIPSLDLVSPNGQKN